MAISHIAAHRGAFYIQHQLQLAIAKKISKVPLSFFCSNMAVEICDVLSMMI